MRHLHIGVFSELGNGHIYPLLPLCAELVSRGHRITYGTSEHFAPYILDSGAIPVIFRGKSPSLELRAQLQTSLSSPANGSDWWLAMSAFQSYRFDFTNEILPQLQQFYIDDKPDLILYDPSMFVGRILARQFERPAIQVSPCFAQYRGFLCREEGTPTNPAPALAYANELDSFLRMHGVETPNNLWHIEDLNIHLIPREFQYGADYFDERFCFVGALLNRKFERRWINRSEGKPIVLVSDLSGLPGAWEISEGFFKIFIEALADVDCHCILSIGAKGDSTGLGSLPPNVEINRTVSHLEILPSTAISVCHAGMLSTLEALYNGVPVLALPLHQDTEEIAYRIVELGAGIRLSRQTLSAETIKSNIICMLDDPLLRQRTKDISRLFRSSGGAKLAADRIEEFAWISDPNGNSGGVADSPRRRGIRFSLDRRSRSHHIDD